MIQCKVLSCRTAQSEIQKFLCCLSKLGTVAQLVSGQKTIEVSVSLCQGPQFTDTNNTIRAVCFDLFF